MKILAFDTSGPFCAAALLEDGEITAARSEEMAKGQAERLMPLLEEILAEAGLDWRALDRIGVGVGPGNFTGIRISVSAARGLALGLGVPAVGVSTLEAMALGQTDIVATLDARLGRFYGQVFGATQGEPVLFTAEAPEGLSAKAAIGPGAAALGLPETAPLYPRAEAIARIAAKRQPIGRPSPLYIRPPDAAPPRDPAPVLLP